MNIIPVGSRVRIKMNYPSDTNIRIPEGTQGTVIDTPHSSIYDHVGSDSKFWLCTIRFDSGYTDSIFQYRLQIKR